MKYTFKLRDVLDHLGLMQEDDVWDIPFKYGSMYDYQEFKKEDILYWLPKKYEYLKSEVDNELSQEIFPDSESCFDVLETCFRLAAEDHEMSNIIKVWENRTAAKIEEHLNNVENYCITKGKLYKDLQISFVDQTVTLFLYERNTKFALYQIIFGEGFFDVEINDLNIKEYEHYLFNAKLVCEIYGDRWDTDIFSRDINYSMFNESYFENQLDYALRT